MRFLGKTVGELLRRGAALYPDRPFLIEDATGRAWSYRQFDVLTDTIAHELVDAGLAPGDRLGVVLPNRMETVALFLAGAKSGAIFSPLNPALTVEELRDLIGRSDPRLICTTDTLASTVRAAATSRSMLTIEGTAASWFAAPAGSPPPAPLPSAAVLMLYTSGSTGKPKGALLTHDNLVVNATEIATWLGLGADDRVMCVMPLFHANALVIGITTPLACGGSVVVCERFSATRFWKTVERFAPTTFGSVATILTMLLERGGGPPTRDRHRLRFALCGSAPVPVSLIDRFQRTFGIPVIEGYGLTECTCRATFNPTAAPRPGSVGLPLGNELRVVDAQGLECEPGGIGEIALRGRNVMQGYFRDADATARVMRDGWLHSGDLGYRDSEGFLHVVGRKSDMIIRGGENIYPREIEDVLHRLAGVVEAAVLGIPDPLYGEAVAATIVATAPGCLTAAAVSEHCRAHLAPFKCPTTIRFVRDLPKNATGKVRKTELRARLATEGSDSAA